MKPKVMLHSIITQNVHEFRAAYQLLTPVEKHLYMDRTVEFGYLLVSCSYEPNNTFTLAQLADAPNYPDRVHDLFDEDGAFTHAEVLENLGYALVEGGS